MKTDIGPLETPPGQPHGWPMFGHVQPSMERLQELRNRLLHPHLSFECQAINFATVILQYKRKAYHVVEFIDRMLAKLCNISGVIDVCKC